MGTPTLSAKEARRVYVLEQLVAGRLTVAQAAQVLGLSRRQVHRLKGGFIHAGVASLVHKNRGRKPARTLPDPLRQRILAAATGPYRDTSCQHLAELLAEHAGIRVHAKTVRRILHAAGIPLRYAKKAARRRRSRERMPQAGLLVPCDASPYAWLEDRGPVLSLHGAIDDATSTVLGLHFRPQEDTVGHLQVLAQVLRDYGVPQSGYSDRHTLFFSPQRDRLTVAQELAGQTVALTQFGRALAALGIQHLPARSPQAKGRVERLWGTLQSRLVTELRVAGVATLEAANAFLPGFLARFNARFAVAPADPRSAFRPSPPPAVLRDVLALQVERKASAGSTISLDGVSYQLVDAHGQVVALRPQAPVTVLRGLDGRVAARVAGRRYRLRALPAPERGPAAAPRAAIPAPPAAARPVPAWTPPPDHPWRRPAPRPRSEPPGRLERFLDRFLDETEDHTWARAYVQR